MDDENECCKQLDEWAASKGDYIIFKHEQYTYIGKVTEAWFPDCINGSDRFVRIELLKTNDPYVNVNIGEEVDIDITRIDHIKDDYFEIITESEALAKVL